MGISLREYARRRGVSHVAVMKAIKVGRITPEPDGSLDPAKVDAQWDDRTDPARRPEAPEDERAGTDPAAASDSDESGDEVAQASPFRGVGGCRLRTRRIVVLWRTLGGRRRRPSPASPAGHRRSRQRRSRAYHPWLVPCSARVMSSRTHVGSCGCGRWNTVRSLPTSITPFRSLCSRRRRSCPCSRTSPWRRRPRARSADPPAAAHRRRDARPPRRRPIQRRSCRHSRDCDNRRCPDPDVADTADLATFRRVERERERGAGQQPLKVERAVLKSLSVRLQGMVEARCAAEVERRLRRRA